VVGGNRPSLLRVLTVWMKHERVNCWHRVVIERPVDEERSEVPITTGSAQSSLSRKNSAAVSQPKRRIQGEEVGLTHSET
jgi:hypothetical protein